MNARHAYEMLTQDLNSELKEARSQVEEKSEAKSKALQTKADAEGDLTDTSTTLADDKAYLGELTGSCQQKAMDFIKRQELRQEELEAIQKAMDIISSNAVQGNAEKHLPSALVETSFAQLRSATDNPVQKRVAQFLEYRAQRIHSKVSQLWQLMLPPIRSPKSRR